MSVTHTDDATGKRTYLIDGVPVDYVPGGYSPGEIPDDGRPDPTMDEMVASGDFADVEPPPGATRAIRRVGLFDAEILSLNLRPFTYPGCNHR